MLWLAGVALHFVDEGLGKRVCSTWAQTPPFWAFHYITFAPCVMQTPPSATLSLAYPLWLQMNLVASYSKQTPSLWTKLVQLLWMHHFTFMSCQMQTVLLGIAGGASPVATLPHLRNTPENATTSSPYGSIGVSLMVADADWSGNHNPQWVFLGLDVNTNLRIKYNNVTLR